MKKFLVATLVMGFAILASYDAIASKEVTVHQAHGIAMHGEPKYGADFKHFDYVNPAARKGGKVVFSEFGSYDSLNPFILKGESAVGVRTYVFESLATSSSDEAFTMYGLLAETIEWPEDRSWVAFTLRPEARWHDGLPVTVEDVIWSLEILKTKGHPFYRAYYANLEKAEKVGEGKVKFTFSGPPNPELPLITGQMPILPKHDWEGRDFETTLDPPIGSGPYKIKSLNPGRSITYELDENYWGKDLPVNVGQNNFGIMRYDYYRDEGVKREAFKAGAIDFFQEQTSKEWATGYNIPAVEKGVMIKREIKNENPRGMQAFVFNTRREVFKDSNVRQALGYAFDYEWTNKNLFYDSYMRTISYFANSELASSGLPSEGELKILEKYRGRIPDKVFTEAFIPPKTDGSGNIRSNLRTAIKQLKEAGWEVHDGKLTNVETGTVMRFEILLVNPSFERIVLPFTKNLEKLGAEANVRTVDTAQYQNRMDSYDFDVTIVTWRQSLSPGNEQRDFWTSEAADTNGTRNLASIKDPVVDELVDLIISAPDRESLINRTRALDRVLLWSHYVIPQWHISAYRVAYWDKFNTPEIMPKYSLGIDTWWVDSQLEAQLAERKRALK